MFSLERRRERYQIIYVWKIINLICPNLNASDNIECYQNRRFGKLCAVPGLIRNSRARAQTIRESSFGVQGPKIFNSMPRRVRDFEGSLDGFKNILDKVLSDIPDEPSDRPGTRPRPIPGLFGHPRRRGLMPKIGRGRGQI